MAVPKKLDWRDNESLTGCLSYLSENKQWHDVSFSCRNNNGKLLHGHRLILSLRSPVFEAIFFGRTAKKQATLDMSDTDYCIFEQILRFIYTDKCEITGKNVLSILNGASKYCISGLIKACSSFLEKSLSSDNVCTIYEQAKMFKVNALEQKCFKFMTNHSSEVSRSPASTILSYKSLLEFLSSEELSGEELDHFNLANKWAEQKCISQNLDVTPENKRKLLGVIITKIRFPVINAKDFAEIVTPTNLLLSEDQVKLFQSIITRKKTFIETYSFAQRKGRCIPVDTRQLTGNMRIYNRFKFIFQFQCNKEVKLVKLFPLRVPGWDDFSVKDISKIRVERFGSKVNHVDVTEEILDTTNFLSKDSGFLFQAQMVWRVQLEVRNRKQCCRYSPYHVKSYNIATRGLDHKTIIDSFSCRILEIPVCVETVEFKIVS